MGVEAFGRSGEQDGGLGPELAEWEEAGGESQKGKCRSQKANSDAAVAFEAMFEAYDRVLGSIRGYDGKPARGTELEKIAQMNQSRRRLAVNARMPPGYEGALTVKETARRLRDSARCPCDTHGSSSRSRQQMMEGGWFLRARVAETAFWAARRRRA